MEIERLWGREPGWLRTLDHETQVSLLGWYRVHLNPRKTNAHPSPHRARSR